jgi:hypothetical protein
MSSQFVMIQSMPLKSVPGISERLIQDHIASNPSVLGLGHLELQAREKVQPSGGRVDLVLRDTSDETWYEVEIQLGKTDESHIVRTIEYWESEKRRHPGREHIAVIVAEKITGRFFNVISLLNQNIPIIALMLTATKLGDQYALLFTKVLHHEPVDVDEDSGPEITEAEWKDRTTPSLLKVVYELANYGKSSLDPTLELKFNKSRIGTWIHGQLSNFVTFHPQKRTLRISFHASEEDSLNNNLNNSGIDWEYKNGRYAGYRVHLHENEIQGNLSLLQTLMAKSYETCEGEEQEHEVDGQS